MLDFPYKRLKNIPYYGVFDKKYCRPIMDKVIVDFIIMTDFIGNPFAVNELERSWGYEVKVLNTKTMIQKKAIGIKGLNTFNEIEEDIHKNIEKLKKYLK